MEYFKNENATSEKLKDGWIYTGDLVRRDKKGYLYFVGRNAEFMRIKGENVSAYEVEHTIQKNPAVLEAAVRRPAHALRRPRHCFPTLLSVRPHPSGLKAASRQFITQEPRSSPRPERQPPDWLPDALPVHASRNRYWGALGKARVLVRCSPEANVMIV